MSISQNSRNRWCLIVRRTICKIEWNVWYINLKWATNAVKNRQKSFCYSNRSTVFNRIPIETGRKLNVHKTFRRRPGRFWMSYVHSIYVRCLRRYFQHFLLIDPQLTHSFPRHPFFTHWKHVFKKQRKGALGTNGLISIQECFWWHYNVVRQTVSRKMKKSFPQKTFCSDCNSPQLIIIFLSRFWVTVSVWHIEWFSRWF